MPSLLAADATLEDTHRSLLLLCALPRRKPGLRRHRAAAAAGAAATEDLQRSLLVTSAIEQGLECGT